MSPEDPLLRLLARFREEDVEYVLVGGQAVRLNGYLRATEDIDVLVRATRENGERVKRALDFLESSRDLDPAWFEPHAGEVENIRVLNIDGLLRTKTDSREKDVLDKRMLERIKRGLGAE